MLVALIPSEYQTLVLLLFFAEIFLGELAFPERDVFHPSQSGGPLDIRQVFKGVSPVLSGDKGFFCSPVAVGFGLTSGAFFL